VGKLMLFECLGQYVETMVLIGKPIDAMSPKE
jgi:hypothetical protein